MQLVHLFADVALAAAGIGCLVFVILYQTLTAGGWRRSAVGRNVMAFMGVCAALLTVAVAREFVDALDAYVDWIRFGSFTTVAVIVWQRVALLIRAQSEDQPDQLGQLDQLEQPDDDPATNGRPHA